MRLTNHPTAQAFLDTAQEALLRHEAENNLILGITNRVRDGGSYGADPPLFLTVEDGGKIVSAAIRTPPYNLILHCDRDRLDALDAIVDHLIEIGHDLPGVHGTVNNAATFADCWTRRSGQTASVLMSQCIYSLTQVTAPSDVAGRMRWAQEADVSTLIEWFLAFHHEAVPGDPPTDPAKNVHRFMTSGKLAVWDDGGPVLMAGSSRGTTNGATVSAVYTPPMYRGHGYASACVAALSQSLLDSGYRFCTLYTDLANPTSNKIYQNVGYQLIENCAMITFENATS